MRITLNADDFGYDDDTVDATIDAMRRGALTGATIMPKMPATARAVEFARSHPEFSFGVHLIYVRSGETTPEAPILPPGELPALADLNAGGRFRESPAVRKDALLGRVPVEQIAAETAAQIQS